MTETERCRICEKLLRRMDFIEHIGKCKNNQKLTHKIINVSDQLVQKIKVFETLRRVMKLELIKNLSKLKKKNSDQKSRIVCNIELYSILKEYKGKSEEKNNLRKGYKYILKA